MRKILLLLFILVLFGINNTFSNNSHTNITSYNQSPIIVNCNNPLTAANPETISDTSGEKYIPTSNVTSGAAGSGNMGCTSYGFFGGNWSAYKSQNNTFVCSNNGYVSKIKCYNNSNNEQTCNSDGSGWTKYKIFCKTKFDDDLVKLNSAPLKNRSIVADGQNKNVEISFPLSSVESDINYIDFHFIITDNTSIDWLSKNKNSISSSAVTVVDTTTSDSFSSQTRTINYRLTNGGNLDTMKSGDKFNFLYKFYNPTEIASDIFPATVDGFIFKTITYDIKFTDGGTVSGYYVENKVNNNNINNSTIPVKLKPLITFNNTGILSLSGFFEGTTQTGAIDITNNNSGVVLTNTGLYLSITGSTTKPESKDYFTGTGEINGDGNKKDIDKGILINKFFDDFTDGLSYVLETLFTLDNTSGGYRDDIKYIRLREFIKYTVGGKNVTYLAGVLNQNNSNNFEKLKIYGRTNISDKKQKDLLANQDVKDIQNLAGNITKSSLKRDIRKSAINTIKFVDTANITQPVNDITNNSWNGSNGGKILGNILYYEFTNGENTIINDSTKLTGKKTLIVRGGNVRIKSNIINNSSSDILGIIVLKGDNGKGGKLYIDTSVKEVDAVIYTDKSIIGYNEYYDNGDSDNIIKHEVDGNINTNILDNQLYIYGSIFSENTIGGSRLNPPICPFWTSLENIDCNTINAQKYDFNYLRTGLGSNPKYSGDPVTGINYPIVIKYNSTIQLGPPPLFSVE